MSEYLTQELDLSPNDVVQVTLSGCESDVFLVDYSNLCSFRRGGSFSYFGGHYRASPVHLSPPYHGRWHLVIKPTGGSVRASTTVFKNAA
jgi:hypothetical protein